MCGCASQPTAYETSPYDFCTVTLHNVSLHRPLLPTRTPIEVLRMLRAVCCLFCLLATGVAQERKLTFPPAETVAQIRPKGIHADMAFLADDLLEGRGTGTRGYMLAAKYIASQFEQLGLKPAGEHGTYFQNVRFRQFAIVSEKSSVIIKRNGQEHPLRFEVDYVTGGDALYPDTSLDAPAAFVGYGVTAPEFKYDDYAGADVKGKIAVMIYGAPGKFPDAPRAHYSSSEIKLQTAVRHGAVGIVSVWAGPLTDRIPFKSLLRFYHSPHMRWLDEKGVPSDTNPQIRGSFMLNRDSAAPLFEGAAKPWTAALEAAIASQPQSFPLPVNIALHIVSSYSEVESPNIAGVLTGSDPELKNQYVVFTAHADHLGIGNPVNGDAIYNGAADDASGVAGILAIARAMAALKTPPKRSLMFLAVAGEEEGLLGSDYYAQHPTVPISQIVADVNLDGLTLFYDFRDIVPMGAEHSTISAEVNDVARHLGVEVSPDPAPEEVYFIRSDQYSFVKQGVPSVFISEGYKTVDPKLDGKQISEDWEAHYYHMPGDDMNQPNLHFDVAAKSARIHMAVGYEIAQAPEKPHWNPGDFFGSFAKREGQ